MRTALLFAVVLATPVFASQPVWKWVDAQGVTHYADRPVPGAERVELNSGTVTTYSAPSYSSSSSSSTSKATDTAEAYRSLEIWKPANDEVLFNVGGDVAVNVRVDPELQPGHTLSLYMDGRLVEGSGTSFTLEDVYRGSHQLVAVVTDQSGERLMQSAPVTFHVRQTSVQNPQNQQRRTRR